MRNFSENSNLLSTLASLTPALVQIFAFFAIDFATKFRINNYLILPDLLTFINFLVLLLSTASIAIYAYFRHNNFTILRGYITQPTNTNTPVNMPNIQKYVFRLLIVLVILIFLTAITFISIVFSNISVHKLPIVPWGILQWLTYSIFLVCISLIIYIWLEDINLKATFEQSQSAYISRVLDRLFETGWISPPKTLLVRPEQGFAQKRLVLEVTNSDGTSRFLDILTSFDGKQLLLVSEYPTNPLQTTTQNQ